MVLCGEQRTHADGQLDVIEQLAPASLIICGSPRYAGGPVGPGVQECGTEMKLQLIDDRVIACSCGPTAPRRSLV